MAPNPQVQLGALPAPSLNAHGQPHGFLIGLALAKALLTFAVLAALFWPFGVAQFRAAYARWPDSGTPTLASRFATWDVAHYLILSQSGYERGSHSCAFYPLWPGALRVATVLTGGRPVLAAMLLANGLSLVGLGLLYRLM